MPTPALPWFKVWIGATAHGKVRQLNDATFRTWAESLDQAAQQPHRGRFRSRKEAAAITRRPAAHFTALIAAGLIDETPEGLAMHDWDTWQRWRKEDAINTGSTPDQHTMAESSTTRSTHDEHAKTPTRAREDVEEEEDVDRDEDVVRKPPPPADPKGPDPRLNEVAGIVAAMEGLSDWPDDATELHDAVQAHLESVGFTCQREYRVADRGDGRPGKVDLIAQRGECRMAVELDRLTPRQKSLVKLAQVTDAVRVVLLRGEPRTIIYPDCVDVIGYLPIPRGKRAKPAHEPLTQVETEALIEKYAERYGGEAEVAQEIAAAINHNARLKYQNERLYVDRWLHKELSLRPSKNGRVATIEPAVCRCDEVRANLAINRNSDPYCGVHGRVQAT